MLTQPESSVTALPDIMVLPDKSQEAWRYTDLRRLVPPEALALLPETEAPDHGDYYFLPDMAAVRLLFINGIFQPALSQKERLPDGVTFDVINDAAKENEEIPVPDGAVLNAINKKGAQSTARIVIEAGSTPEKPLHIIHANHGATPGACHTRLTIRLGAGARATILETRTGEGAAPLFSTQMTALTLDSDARLDHVILTEGQAGMMHVDNRHVTVESDAHYKATVLALGGRVVRGESHVRYAGSGGQVNVTIAALACEDETTDHVVTMNHDVPDCTGEVMARTVVGRKGTGVFQGRVHVSEGAQRVESRQTTRALLLSPDGVMNAKPELDILADDVQCAHGSVIGELDEEALYYLRSRGISADEAQRLLVGAFLSDVEATITHEEICGEVWSRVMGRLDQMIDQIGQTDRTTGEVFS